MTFIFWLFVSLAVIAVLAFIVWPVFNKALLQPDAKEISLVQQKKLRMILVSSAGLLPILLMGIYLQVGSINLLGKQRAQVSTQSLANVDEISPEDRAEMIEGMVDGLAARLTSNPEDVAGWRMLARSQIVLGRLDEAEESYKQLLSVDDVNFQDWQSLADVQIAISENEFPIEESFLETLEQINSRWRDHPYVLYYRGGVKHRRNNLDGALADWRKLLVSMPETQPARAPLAELIEKTEMQRKNAMSVPE